MEAWKEEVRAKVPMEVQRGIWSVEIKDVQQLHSQSREEFETDTGRVGWDSGKENTLKQMPVSIHEIVQPLTTPTSYWLWKMLAADAC